VPVVRGGEHHENAQETQPMMRLSSDRVRCNNSSVSHRMGKIRNRKGYPDGGIRCRYSALQNAIRRGDAGVSTLSGDRRDVFFYRQFSGAVSERFAGAPCDGVAGGGEEGARPYEKRSGSNPIRSVVARNLVREREDPRFVDWLHFRQPGGRMADRCSSERSRRAVCSCPLDVCERACFASNRNLQGRKKWTS
jgi:hypothetical protein